MLHEMCRLFFFQLVMLQLQLEDTKWICGWLATSMVLIVQVVGRDTGIKSKHFQIFEHVWYQLAMLDTTSKFLLSWAVSKKPPTPIGKARLCTPKPQRSHSEVTAQQLLVPGPPRRGVRGGVNKI